MAKILVTGANGHIGANTVRSLLSRGYEVVPFVRSTSDLRGIDNLGLTYHYGDVLNYASLLKAAEECDSIIHLATVYRLWAKNPDDILQTAVLGTQNIFKTARKLGIRRLVYTSSMVAVGLSRRPQGLRTAADWNENPKSPYFIAKTKSEREALRLSQEYAVPTIRLCPTQVIGPYDYRLTPTMKSILDFINKTATTYEAGGNYVHVHDVSEVHALALEHGEPGSRFIVGGDNIHLKELSAMITKLTGVKTGHLGLTGPIAEVLGAIVGFTSSITGSEPPYNREITQDIVGRYGYFDCTPVEKTFGIIPCGIEEVLKDTIRWLLFMGKIRPEVAERITPDFLPDPDW